MDCLRHPTVESTQFIGSLYRIADLPFGAVYISITDRLHSLCCQYDFMRVLSANIAHETKLNINHAVCPKVWTYYKHTTTGLHKNPSFFYQHQIWGTTEDQNTERPSRKTEIPATWISQFSVFLLFFLRTKGKVLISSVPRVSLHLNKVLLKYVPVHVIIIYSQIWYDCCKI